MWQISKALYQWLQEKNSELAALGDEDVNGCPASELEEELSFLTIKLEEEGRVKKN